MAIFSSTTIIASAHEASGGKNHIVSSTIRMSIVRPKVGMNVVHPNLSGNQLNGLDPASSGCWDSSAYVANEKVQGSLLLAIWYSPTCGTNWADFQNESTPGRSMRAMILRYSGRDGGAVIEESSVVTYTRAWSPMVYAPNESTAASGFFGNDGNPAIQLIQ